MIVAVRERGRKVERRVGGRIVFKSPVKRVFGFYYYTAAVAAVLRNISNFNYATRVLL